MTTDIEEYFTDGCMRCKYGATPQCKVLNWAEELHLLRAIAQSAELTEEMKWGIPVYTLNGKNIFSINALKNSANISFFKGALLPDTHKILHQQGANSQLGRIIKFTDKKQIVEIENLIKIYIKEAVDIEKKGEKIVLERKTDAIPEELSKAFEENPNFKKAFYELTLGRQRGYLIYFSQPKQTQTRIGRIEKYKEQIFNKIGLNDRPKK